MQKWRDGPKWWTEGVFGIPVNCIDIFIFSLDCTLERKKDENTELSFIRTRYRIEFYQDAINYYLLDTPYPKIGDANLKCALWTFKQ